LYLALRLDGARVVLDVPEVAAAILIAFFDGNDVKLGTIISRGPEIQRGGRISPFTGVAGVLIWPDEYRGEQP
jgi:hypothetical protein